MEKIKILLVEDNDSDAQLIMSAVRREGLEAEWLRADDQASFLEALAEDPQAIVTDFNLPSFSALAVLALMREKGRDIPVLVVTGAIDDELAAECVKQGASDYLLKDRLARLRDALEGAIERYRVERQKHDTERRLLAAAASRAVLNDMLLNSLSVDLSESSIRAVLMPLFLYNSPSALEMVVLEAPDLTRLVVERPRLVPAISAEASAKAEGDAFSKIPPNAVLRVTELSDAGSSGGKLSFVFSPGTRLDRESEQFLGEVAYVMAGVLRRARAERGLLKSLAEQDELLREIHHRVKNNLAAVQSLVSLEAAKLDEGPGKAALAGIEGQVRSMALVHEMLYSRGGFTGIDFEDYVRELRIRVADTAGCPYECLDLSTECQGLCVPLESAVTLGLLFNELFAHAAYRVASSEVREEAPRIGLSVTAHPTEGRQWQIEYREREGEGFMHGTWGSNSGLEFVEMFLPQYKGSIESSGEELRVFMNISGDSSAQACV